MAQRSTRLRKTFKYPADDEVEDEADALDEQG